ncbi:SMI1/KNR4 family protein [Candidatus Accumulibacter phosphatis]|uniref:SMI1/KNR4 family protein n=1 Tax=Candidatus Accumulibacter phosphatis TaxID=327160 RepID=A0A5S4EGK7_9PROT|nr:SMI1/KNR4 family protein [Candidatus Accumulibacter phosphatis]TMQ74374.1 hypothetical protein ACCUM_1872 [Candidatus Accumulibacter phosphatis]
MPVLEQLRSAVQSHSGQFVCSEIHHAKNSKTVHFRHLGTPPEPDFSGLEVNGLRDFYSTFGELTLYLEEESGDAAYFLANPSQWESLDSDFRPWLEGIGDDEADDYLPDWISNCIVVGEIPRSGNYLLIPTTGPETGKVFEFEHDGFEFIELGTSLPDFVERTLDLDPSRLAAIASHVRFITENDGRPWWIEELHDNRGNVIHTEA